MDSKDTNVIDRRGFIEMSTKGAAAIKLASLSMLVGCENEKNPKKVFGACYHDCPDRCSWEVTSVDNKVTAFEASKTNPYTAGRLCDKMENFPNDVTYHPDRILKPLKRTGPKGAGKFEEISWNQAISEIAVKLKSIINSKGGEAVLPYSFGGNQGLIHRGAVANRFFAHIGASQLERTICGDTAVAGILATNGQTTGVLPEDIVHSKYIVLWGTNPVLSNQHLWLLIEKARAEGARIVVVDPFKSRTSEKSDWHIQPKPGTDTALALGLMHVILNEQLEDRDYIEKYTLGIEELTEHVRKYEPEYVSGITGLDKDTIVQFAREYAKGSPSLIRVLIGMEHQVNGGSAFRSIAMLPALTGAWRKEGGGLMNMTYELFGKSLNWEGVNLPSELVSQTTRKINMIELGKALNSTDLNPVVDALFVYNSNPAVTTPNQNLVINGLKREDLLTVVLEHFITDTAKYADYVFPATTVLESWDIFTSWGTPYININEPAISPLGLSKSNSDFFRLLSKEMGFREKYLYESDLDMIKETLDSKHEYMKGISFESLRESGGRKLNLPKSWMPHSEGNFGTSSGKCHFYDEKLAQPLPEYIPYDYDSEEIEKHPLQLLTIKTPEYFLNSSHANVDHILKKEGDLYLEISEYDAEKREISTGDELRVFNSRGRVFCKARISDKVKVGIVCLPQGYWPSLLKGNSSANALTNDLLTDMGRGGAIQEARVDIEKVNA